MSATKKFQILTLFLLTGAVMLFSTAFASESSSGTLPYESWLQTLQQSLTGPVAFSVAMIGIVTCGATLILSGGEIGRFMQSLIFIVLVMTLLIGANSLMTRFFNGASIGLTAQTESSYPKNFAPNVVGSDLRFTRTLHQRLSYQDFADEYQALAYSYPKSGSNRLQGRILSIKNPMFGYEAQSFAEFANYLPQRADKKDLWAEDLEHDVAGTPGVYRSSYKSSVRQLKSIKELEV